MKTYLMADPVRYPAMTTAQIRETFLIDALYEPGALCQVYVDLDRAVVGLAAPLATPITLAPDTMLRANYFLERRELGALILAGRALFASMAALIPWRISTACT
jgi:4-deoxy-L-threo-5-hexosulose-uronate ketol-isomerase